MSTPIEIIDLILTPIVTIIAGGFGLYIYYRQKKEHKRNIANIILMEIRQATATIKEIRAGIEIDETTIVLPINTWSKEQHLFTKDFDYSQRENIANFYRSAQIIHEAVKEANYYTMEARAEKVRVYQSLIGHAATTGIEEDYLKVKRAINSLFVVDSETVRPNGSRDRILKHANTITLIENTPIEEKIKEII